MKSVIIGDAEMELPVLTREKVALFIYFKGIGLNNRQAAQAAGYSHPGPTATRLMKQDYVREAVEALQNQYRDEVDLKKDDVLRIVMEGIGMAKIQSDPMSIFRGAQELNKMMGFYEPEKKEIKVNKSAEQRIQEMETMDIDELTRMAYSDAIDGEFEEIDEQGQDENM